jgi:predicted nucleic acid-binding Zn ribbon protein
MGRKSHEFPTEKRHKLCCMMCGHEHHAARPDKKTCSNKCRLKLSRLMRKEGQGYMDTERIAREKNEHEAIAYALRMLGRK